MTCMLWFHGVNELSFLLMISEAHRISERFVGKLDTLRNHLKPLRNTKRVKLQRFLCREGFYQLGTVWFHLSKWGEEPQHGFYYISTDILELLLGRPGPHGVLCQKQIMSPHPSTTAEKPSLVKMHWVLPTTPLMRLKPRCPRNWSGIVPIAASWRKRCTKLHRIFWVPGSWDSWWIWEKRANSSKKPQEFLTCCFTTNGKYTSTAILRGHDVFKIHNGSIWDGRLDGFVNEFSWMD